MNNKFKNPKVIIGHYIYIYKPKIHGMMHYWIMLMLHSSRIGDVTLVDNTSGILIMVDTSRQSLYIYILNIYIYIQYTDDSG